MKRRNFLSLTGLLALSSHGFAQRSLPAAEATPSNLEAVLDRAAELSSLRAVIVSRDGVIVGERGYRGHSVARATNIKSASKAIVAALVGIAIDKGLLEGPDQKIAPLLSDLLPPNADPRLQEITVGHLLSMQAGLERTSGPNYGRWVSSSNWIRAALAQPFVDQPGGRMLYSTGSTHLLSAILTRQSGRSTRALAGEWLGALEHFAIGSWERDPQGIYLGGNQMAMSTRSLLAFGELYRNRGRTADGLQLVPADWIAQSWTLRTHSQFNGDGYGYGWFLREIGGEDVRYAWGYGGQMLYVVPQRGLSVAMTSNEDSPSARSGYRDQLHGLLSDIMATI